MSGRLRMDLNVAHMAFDTALAVLCSIFVYCSAALAWRNYGVAGGAADGDLWTFGTTVFTVMVVAMTASAATLVDTWIPAVHVPTVVFQIAMVVSFTLLMGEAAVSLDYLYFGAPYVALRRAPSGCSCCSRPRPCSRSTRASACLHLALRDARRPRRELDRGY